MKAIILAAGYATRLYPLTKDKPKPLLEIAGKPMINYILERLEEAEEITDVYVVTNDKFFNSFEEWKNNTQSRINIEIINDGTTSNETRLGAVGDIDFVLNAKKVDDDVVVIAGDNLFEFSIKSMVGFHKEKQTSVVAVYDMKDKALLANKLGVIQLNEASKIINFEEKPAEPRSTLASTACYLFTRDDIAELRKCIEENKKPDNSGDFVRYISEKKDVHGYTFDEGWFDIGSFDQLEEANKLYSKRQQ